MSTDYQIKEPDKLHYITLQVVEWVDIFSREVDRKIIVENLAYCQANKDLEIYAWVIMSNHVHLLLRSNKEELSDMLRDFKSYTSKKIIEQVSSDGESRKVWMLKIFQQAAFSYKRNADYQFWTHDNHAEIAFSNKFIEQKLAYIHNNPVRAGLVEKPEDYIYSSAVDYAGGKGLLEIELITTKWKTYN